MTNRTLGISLLAGVAFWGSCTSPQVPEGEYRIEGRLRNVPDSTVIELFMLDGRNVLPVDQDTVMDGRFVLSDTIACTSPRKMMIISMSKGFPNRWLEIWVQSGKRITVTGEDCLLPLWTVDSDVEEQCQANEFLKLRPEDRAHAVRLQVEVSDCYAGDDPLDVKRAKMDSLDALGDRADSVVFAAELEYMKTAPMSAVWLDKLAFYCKFVQYNPGFGRQDLLRQLFGRMSEEDKATPAGQEIVGYMTMRKQVDVGDDMADGDLYDVDGQVRHLAEFKGKYILLDFWSRGCLPCYESLPEVEEIAETYKDRMEVVSICMDSEDIWKEFVAQKQLTGNQWNELRKDETGLAGVYRVRGIPHYVMIGPDGKVLQMWSGYGYGSLKRKMAELLQ